MKMFQYQINKGNLNDLALLPTSRFFEDIKLSLSPELCDADSACHDLIEQGYVRISGLYPTFDMASHNNPLNKEYLTSFVYLAKPTKEVLEHLGNIKFSVSVPQRSGDFEGNETRNVIFTTSMPGSSSGMTSTSIAGAVEVQEHLEHLGNCECVSTMSDDAYKAFHREHPNVKFTTLNSNSSAVIKKAETLFIALGLQHDRPELIKGAIDGDYKYFYNNDEQIKLVIEHTQATMDMFHYIPEKEPKFQIVSYFGDNRINKGNIEHLAILDKSKLNSIIAEAMGYGYNIMTKQLSKNSDDIEFILYISENSFSQR